jgi:hypothetical protein
MRHFRYLLIGAPRLGIYRVNWNIIIPRSFIVITAAEAQGTPGTESAPNRFIGEAKPIVVGCIGAHEGFVEYTMWWWGDFPYLNIWADVTVLDA